MKESTLKRTNRLLAMNNLRAKKQYGQNYLVDDNTIRRIVDQSGVDETVTVVEIGPGLGSLTQELLQRAQRVIAYEIDESLIPILNKEFADKKHFTLTHADILKRDIDKDLRSLGINETHTVHVVANLPYYITTPILTKLLEESDLVSRYTLMAQYEVARRLTASTNTKDYNALSVLIHYKTNPVFAFKVPRNVFIPPPNVDSAIITMDVAPPPEVVDEAVFFDFVQNAFKQKRKTLVNNISRAYTIEKTSLNDFFKTLGHKPMVRAESLSVNDFVEIVNAFYHYYI